MTVAAKPTTTRANPFRSPAKTEERRMISNTKSNQLNIFVSSGAITIVEQAPFGDSEVGVLVLITGSLDYLGRQRRGGRKLVPGDSFQVVANVLLIEGKLRASGLVSVGGPVAR